MNKSMVILSSELWTKATTKEELKQNISWYMNKNYPSYIVLEIHKHHAICDIGR